MSTDEQSSYLTATGEESASAPEAGGSEQVVAGSPLSLRNLLNLYLRPSYFFSNHSWLSRRYEIILVAWLAGVIAVQNRIDANLAKFGASAGPPVISKAPEISDAWLLYFSFSLIVGMVSAAILWFIAGWWYHARLELSGAEDVPIGHARAAYQYQNLVQTLPSLVFVIVVSLQYSNYFEYWREDSGASATILLVFSYWSCWTSYRASCTFSVSKWKARVWFLILPALFYSFLFGFLSMPSFSIGPLRFGGY